MMDMNKGDFLVENHYYMKDEEIGCQYVEFSVKENSKRRQGRKWDGNLSSIGATVLVYFCTKSQLYVLVQWKYIYILNNIERTTLPNGKKVGDSTEFIKIILYKLL